jgi:hypothetical protein
VLSPSPDSIAAAASRSAARLTSGVPAAGPVTIPCRGRRPGQSRLGPSRGQASTPAGHYTRLIPWVPGLKR